MLARTPFLLPIFSCRIYRKGRGRLQSNMKSMISIATTAIKRSRSAFDCKLIIFNMISSDSKCANFSFASFSCTRRAYPLKLYQTQQEKKKQQLLKPIKVGLLHPFFLQLSRQNTVIFYILHYSYCQLEMKCRTILKIKQDWIQANNLIIPFFGASPTILITGFAFTIILIIKVICCVVN